MSLQIVQTCAACPEQYDVFHEGIVVGYLRLRHGVFTAQMVCFDRLEELVYQADARGDGQFFNQEERDFHISCGMDAIRDKITL